MPDSSFQTATERRPRATPSAPASGWTAGRFWTLGLTAIALAAAVAAMHAAIGPVLGLGHLATDLGAVAVSILLVFCVRLVGGLANGETPDWRVIGDPVLLLPPAIAALTAALVAADMAGHLAASWQPVLLGGVVMTVYAAGEAWRLWMEDLQQTPSATGRPMDRRIALALAAAFFGGLGLLTAAGVLSLESHAHNSRQQEEFAQLGTLAARQSLLAQALGRDAALSGPRNASDIRDTLFAEAQDMRRQADRLAHDFPPPGSIRSAAAQAASARLALQEAADLQAAVDRFLPAMDGLAAVYGDWARDVTAQSQARLRAAEWLIGLLALLYAGLLALPTVRIAVARYDRMRADSLSSRRLSLIARHATNIILMSDTDGRIQWVNRAFEQLTGYRSRDVIGRRPRDFLVSENTDPKAIAETIAAIRAQKPFRTEMLHVARDGREYWVDMDIKPILADDGTCEGFIQVQTDVTQQVGLQTHLDRIYRTMPAGIVILDGEGRILDGNAEAERLLYQSRDQMRRSAPRPSGWLAVDGDGHELASELCPAMETLHTRKQVRNFVMGVQTERQPRRWLQVDTIALPKAAPDEPAVIATFLDITEQRRQGLELEKAHGETRQALTSLEAYQVALQDNAIVSMTDDNGHLVHVNAAFCQISGYDEAELLGEDYSRLISDEHPADFYRGIRKTLDQGHTWRGEICIRHKDGGLFWVESIAFEVRGPDGVSRTFVSISMDITRRKRAETLVRRSEGRMRQALMMANAEAWEADLDSGRMSLPTDPTTELGAALTGGRTLDQVIALIHGDDRGQMVELWKAHLAGGPAIDFEHRLRLTDGSYRWVRTFARAETGGDGAGVVYGLTQDVREAKQQEVQLKLAEQEAEERYRREGVLTHALIDAMAGTDLDEFLHLAVSGLINHTTDLSIEARAGVFLADADDAGSALTLARSISLGADLEERCARLPAGHCLCGRAADLRLTQHTDAGEIVPTRHGTAIVSQCHYNIPLMIGDEAIGMLVVFLPSDHVAAAGETAFLERFGSILAMGIDRRRQLDALARARRTAEAAARIKSEFLATMSHEIRTPMNGILGMLELLNQSTLSGDQAKWAQIASQSAESLLRIINDVLDLSKIEAGKMVLETLRFSPRELVSSVYELMKVKADEKGLAFHLDIDPGVPAAMTSDPTRIRQVLFNLIGNAIKFTRSGSVTLCVEPAGWPPQGGLRFSVIDTGIGMDPAQKDRLFEPFAQADGSTTRQFGGTGLGLAISRRLVDGLGGRIDFDSTPGEGTHFSVDIPTVTAADSESAAREPAPDTAAAPETDIGRGLRILVAEDNVLNQQVIRGLLEPDHDLTLCGDGAKALDLCGREAFDIILMDVHMPKMDGVTATAEIKALGVATPIIALTADLAVGSAMRTGPRGFDGLVVKPFKVRDLYTEMSRVLAAGAASAVRKAG